MATAMSRSDAPKGETIDEGSSGSLGPPPPINGDLGTSTTNGAGVSGGGGVAGAGTATSHQVNVAAGTVRIEIVITAGAAAPAVTVRQGGAGVSEKAVRPWTDPDYDNRAGYAADFLTTPIPMPTLKMPSVVAKLTDGEHELKYQNFSVVMHKQRRLCLFTAANVDNAARRRRPDPSRKYGRAALGGLGPNDTEVWFTDPRLPEQFQLPDRFFTKDAGSFDRGHVVMRESVCWGDSYGQVRRANGDTYHTTNCTPQVAGFNQSSKLGRWGQLENELSRRLKQERMTVFAGPVLTKDDWWFDGVDDKGSVRVQIPSRFWKLVVGNRDNKLVAFAFRLEQDLSDVPLEEELDLDPEAWREELVSVEALDKELRELAFPDVIKDADQYEEELGQVVTEELGLAPLKRR
jgi:endonuclease G, mitochondrial